MADIQTIVMQETIQNQIFTIRGKQVMLDRDLAILFGVETKVLNQTVKRNLDRFPDNFRFQLTDREQIELVTFCDRFKMLKHSTSLMYAFSEVGVVMLSSVLRSQVAISVSIQIANAFLEMRRFLKDNAEVFLRIDDIEQKHLRLAFDTNKKFDQVFTAIQSHDLKPKQGIFYDGQIFDAYTFIADLIRDAKNSIVLIDNYVDDTVLRLFTKRNKSVSLMIYTKTISPQLSLDLQKHNEQYSPVIIKTFKDAHDRFLIIDENTVYHIGASLKDLGKKWFAFSKMEIGALDMLVRLRE